MAALELQTNDSGGVENGRSALMSKRCSGARVADPVMCAAKSGNATPHPILVARFL